MIYHILLAFVVTFIITVVLGKIAIPMLRSLPHNKVFVKKVQKVIRRKRVRQQWVVLHDDRPCSWCCYFRTMECRYRHVIVLTLGHCLLGFFDDFVKAVKNVILA